MRFFNQIGRPDNSNETVDPLRRSLVFSAATAPLTLGPLAALAQTNNAVEAALVQAIGEIPTGSNLARHAANQPSQIVEQMQRALAHFRQADINDQTPPRSSQLLERQIAQLGSTISVPRNPQILEYFHTAHASLNERLNQGQYGLFIDGGTETLYVVQKSGGNITAVRQMRVSAAAAGFSNRTNSGGSPFGEMWISSVELERLHEAILNVNTDYINDEQLTRPGGPVTISSVRLSLSDYRDDNRLAQRGAAIHGSVDPDNPSAGCFRGDDVDMAILAQNYLIPNNRINEVLHTGTPMYVALANEQNRAPIERNSPETEVIAGNQPSETPLSNSVPLVQNTPVKVGTNIIPTEAAETTTAVAPDSNCQYASLPANHPFRSLCQN